MLIFVPRARPVAGLQAKGELGKRLFAMCLFFISLRAQNATKHTSSSGGLVLGNVRVGVRVSDVLVVWPPHKCRVGDGLGLGLGSELKLGLGLAKG